MGTQNCEYFKFGSAICSFLLVHWCLKLVWVLIYNLWVLKIVSISNLVALLKFLKLYTFYILKFWAVRICGLQICWYPKYVGTQKCG